MGWKPAHPPETGRVAMPKHPPDLGHIISVPQLWGHRDDQRPGGRPGASNRLAPASLVNCRPAKCRQDCGLPRTVNPGPATGWPGATGADGRLPKGTRTSRKGRMLKRPFSTPAAGRGPEFAGPTAPAAITTPRLVSGRLPGGTCTTDALGAGGTESRGPTSRGCPSDSPGA